MRYGLMGMMTGLLALYSAGVFAETVPAPVKPGAIFISLESQRNLANHKKPQLHVPERFLSLRNNQRKFFSLRSRTSPSASAPLSAALQGAAPHAPAVAEKNTAHALSSDQAHQILSIFAQAD